METTPDEYYPRIPKYEEIIDVEDDSQGALTFGFELEFLLATLEGDQPDPDTDESRDPLRTVVLDSKDRNTFLNIKSQVDKHLINLLETEGLPTRSEEEEKFHPSNNIIPIYNEWRISKDLSVFMKNSIGAESYRWHSREVSSIVMGSDNPGYPNQIEKVCRALRKGRLHLNDTASVHVHVGRGDESFSLLTIKKFATLYWLTEAPLMKLQHPCRQSNKWCFHLTQMSNLAAKTSGGSAAGYRALAFSSLGKMNEFVPYQLSEPLRTQFRWIWGCAKIEELAELMEGFPKMVQCPRGSVGFTRFLPADETGGNTQTFEWRQMAASLDPDHILRWIRVCVAFTDFARGSTAEEFKGLLRTILERGSSYTGFDLLESLGLHAEAEYYKKKVEGYSNNPEVFAGQGAGKLFVPPL
ncbi:hypothetical protein F4810DRAFT_711572 [Camillea tinctor]|nr:hypothetical protein F4810DRAFT_711572 [Camillea tinctor]